MEFKLKRFDNLNVVLRIVPADFAWQRQLWARAVDEMQITIQIENHIFFCLFCMCVQSSLVDLGHSD